MQLSGKFESSQPGLPELAGYIMGHSVQCFPNRMMSLLFYEMPELNKTLSEIHLLLIDASIHHATVNLIPRSDGRSVPKVMKVASSPVADLESRKRMLTIAFQTGDMQISYRESLFILNRQSPSLPAGSSNAEEDSDGK